MCKDVVTCLDKQAKKPPRDVVSSDVAYLVLYRGQFEPPC